MSIFASRTQREVPIPFGDEPGKDLVVIQKLTGRQLGKAQQAFFNELVAGVQARGGAKVQKDIESLFASSESAKAVAEAAEKAKAQPLNGYDRHTLILYGVKSWTLEPRLDGMSVEARTVLFDDLEDDAVEFFATEVLRLTKPALFQSQAEQADDRKNA